MRPIKGRGRKALEMIWSVGAYGGARFPNPSTKVEAVQFVFGFGRPNSYGKSPSHESLPRPYVGRSCWASGSGGAVVFVAEMSSNVLVEGPALKKPASTQMCYILPLL